MKLSTMAVQACFVAGALASMQGAIRSFDESNETGYITPVSRRDIAGDLDISFHSSVIIVRLPSPAPVKQALTCGSRAALRERE